MLILVKADGVPGHGGPPQDGVDHHGASNSRGHGFVDAFRGEGIDKEPGITNEQKPLASKSRGSVPGRVKRSWWPHKPRVLQKTGHIGNLLQCGEVELLQARLTDTGTLLPIDEKRDVA